MSAIDDTVGKLARVYDSQTDTWVPLVGSPAPHLHEIKDAPDVNITEPLLNNDILKYSTSASAFINTSSTELETLTVSGKADFSELVETIVDVSISSGSVTTNFNDGNIFYIDTSPSENFTINATNVPTVNNKATTFSIIVKQGSTGYIPSNFAINGSSQTIRWVGGANPTPTSTLNDIDIFSFTLLRLSDSWIVLGNYTLDM